MQWVESKKGRACAQREKKSVQWGVLTATEKRNLVRGMGLERMSSGGGGHRDVKAVGGLPSSPEGRWI